MNEDSVPFDPIGGMTFHDQWFAMEETPSSDSLASILIKDEQGFKLRFDRRIPDSSWIMVFYRESTPLSFWAHVRYSARMLRGWDNRANSMIDKSGLMIEIENPTYGLRFVRHGKRLWRPIAESNGFSPKQRVIRGEDYVSFEKLALGDDYGKDTLVEFAWDYPPEEDSLIEIIETGGDGELD